MAATVVAVTGDVGAGKSTVSKLLSLLTGWPRLDADAVALTLWRRPEIVKAAVDRWGADILTSEGERDGRPAWQVSSRAVAARIFSAPAEYNWCCGLLHPRVLEELKLRVLELPSEQRAVVEIPLLFEAGRPDWVSKVVFVTAPWEARVGRCQEQRGWDEAELLRREKFFLPSGERMRHSDFVIDNAGDLHSLEAEVRRVADSL